MFDRMVLLMMAVCASHYAVFAADDALCCLTVLDLPHTLVLTWEVQMQASFQPGRETGGFVSRAAKQCVKEQSNPSTIARIPREAKESLSQQLHADACNC